jgi:hypothetical protein
MREERNVDLRGCQLANARMTVIAAIVGDDGGRLVTVSCHLDREHEEVRLALDLDRGVFLDAPDGFDRDELNEIEARLERWKPVGDRDEALATRRTLPERIALAIGAARSGAPA